MTSTAPRRSKQMIAEYRATKALQVKQDFMCLAVQGYVVVGSKALSAEEYRAKFTRDLHYRLNAKERPYSRGTNAMRAADIARNGSKSRWWFARDSINPSGGDKRGIKWYLAKWKRGRGIAPVDYAIAA